MTALTVTTCLQSCLILLRTTTQSHPKHEQQLLDTKLEHESHRKAVQSTPLGVWACCHGYNLTLKVLDFQMDKKKKKAQTLNV